MARDDYDRGWGFGRLTGRGDNAGYAGYDAEFNQWDRARFRARGGMQGGAMQGGSWSGSRYDADVRGRQGGGHRGITWLGAGRVNEYDEGLRGRGSPNQDLHGGLSRENLPGYDRDARGYDGGGYRGTWGGSNVMGSMRDGARWGRGAWGHVGMDEGRGYDQGFRGARDRHPNLERGGYRGTDAHAGYGGDSRMGVGDESYYNPVDMGYGTTGYDNEVRGRPRRY